MRSPCVKVCKLEKNVCIGCKRTLQEIASWSRYSKQQRQEIIQRLKNVAHR